MATATTVLVTILAFLGCLTLTGWWLRALMGTLARGAQVLLGREAAQVRRKQGDLTGFAEAEQQNRQARVLRLRAAARLSFCTVLLALPLFTIYGRWVWAAFGVVTLVRMLLKRVAAARRPV